MDFAALLTTEGLLALLTLTAMETVLGIDNVVFISVLCDRLPEARRAAARRLGLVRGRALRGGLFLNKGGLEGVGARCGLPGDQKRSLGDGGSGTSTPRA